LLRALQGLAFGDAYGLQYECFWPPPRLEWIDPRSLGFGCVDECGGRCCYSDDTELAVAAAECFIETGLGSVAEFARCLANRIDTSARVRYFSTATKDAISRIRCGYNPLDAAHQTLELCREDPSPAVRAIGVALAAPSIDQAMSLAAAQTIATHICREAVERAMAIAAATYMVVAEGISHRRAIEELPHVARWSWELSRALSAIPSAATDPPYRALDALRRYRATAIELGLLAAYGASNCVEALSRAISLGGDVDTAAAVACSLVSASAAPPPLDLLRRIDGIERIRALALRISLRRAVMRAS